MRVCAARPLPKLLPDGALLTICSRALSDLRTSQDGTGEPVDCLADNALYNVGVGR